MESCFTIAEQTFFVNSGKPGLQPSLVVDGGKVANECALAQPCLRKAWVAENGLKSLLDLDLPSVPGG